MQNLFFQLPFHFDAERLLKDLDSCLALKWIDHFNKNDYTGNWKVIALRSSHGTEDSVYAHPGSTFSDAPLLQACPYFREIVDSFLCEKEAIRLMQLSPGSEIKEHRDQRQGYEDGIFRIHIPIITEPEVLFYFYNIPVHMGAGECWYGNFNAPHRVVHNGLKPRIHLVMDCIRNAWSDELFRQSGYDFEWEEMERRKARQKDIPQMIELLEHMDTETARTLIAALRKEMDNGE